MIVKNIISYLGEKSVYIFLKKQQINSNILKKIILPLTNKWLPNV